MAKGNATKFLQGTVIGLALGVAASIYLGLKKGKIVKEDIADIMADFYKDIAPKLKKINKMGEKEYKLFMEKAAVQYAKTKKISAKMAKQLMAETQKSWKHFSSHVGK
jgi:gas vesicle protein